MKRIQSYIVGLAAIGALAFTGCETDFDPVPVEIPVADLTPNTTLLELKTEFWDDATNYIMDIPEKEDGSHYIIHGHVVSSDDAGNIFKSLVIQDETCALAFSINTYDLYVNYRVGQEIVVDATGMQIGKYNGLQQMGEAEWYENGNAWEASFMPLEVFRSHVQLNGLPDVAKVDTIQINAFSELPSDPDGLRRFQSQLVRFNNVKFQEGGKELFSEYQSSGVNRLIEDSEGATLNVRTSGYSDFWNNVLPEGNGDLVCILGYYGTTGWQLNLIDYAGCINFGNPTVSPGTKDNPYSIEQAIAAETAGKHAAGWVTGYIVGTVAPEVTTISSSSDIEWNNEPVLANTLVIGPTPECKDVAQCLVLSLPQDSPLRQYASLRDNPGVYQKQIWIYGTLEEYMGSWGLTGNKGSADLFRIDGVEVGGAGAPAGDGTQASPYNVTQVIGGVSGTAWITGYIVGTITDKDIKTESEFGTANANPANILIALTPDVTDYKQCVPVQLLSGSAVRTAVNLKDHPENLGKSIKLEGSLEKYFGVPGLKSVTAYELGDGGGETPNPPTTTALYKALDPSESALTTGWTIENVNTGGLENVWSWKIYNNAGYLNGSGYSGGAATATEAYAISPVIDLTNATDPSLTFDHAAKFQTTLKSLCGVVAREEGTTTWTSLSIPTWPEAGAWTFVNSGAVDLKAFAGKKIQIAFKYGSSSAGADTWEIRSLVVSATGGGQGGGTVTPDPGPDTPDNPDNPVTPGDADVTILATAIGAVPGSSTVDGYTINIQKENGGTNPAHHDGTSAIRLYAKNSMTISGDKMKSIVIVLSKDASYRYTTVTANTGTIAKQAEGDTQIVWTGDASSVTFTVGDNATLGSDGATKAGQIRFTELQIEKAE
ncbi:MAG: DUF6359 domain-containing protein [Ruminococcus flavefaciens]|nr:DUF6359 domain-containing protein [Ruminococcus flavefaciens]